MITDKQLTPQSLVRGCGGVCAQNRFTVLHLLAIANSQRRVRAHSRTAACNATQHNASRIFQKLEFIAAREHTAEREVPCRIHITALRCTLV